jgi:hypothetical protein
MAMALALRLSLSFLPDIILKIDAQPSKHIVS